MWVLRLEPACFSVQTLLNRSSADRVANFCVIGQKYRHFCQRVGALMRTSEATDETAWTLDAEAIP